MACANAATCVPAFLPVCPRSYPCARRGRARAGLASGRDGLEFAVDTGWITLRPRAAGVRVDGIELSQHVADVGVFERQSVSPL